MNPHQSITAVPAAAPESRSPGSQISAAKLTANQKNAQLSAGPTSSAGKAKSSLNAVKTGLTGRTVPLPTDDAHEHVSQFEKEYAPVGLSECALVQSIADTFCRLDRIRSLEWAIFAKGHTQFAEMFAHEDPSARPALIDLHTFLIHEKQIRNRRIQEARLQRRREKDSAELRQLQQQRRAREAEALEATTRLCAAAKRDNRPFDPATPVNGFVFSMQQIEAHITRRIVAQNPRASTSEPIRANCA